MRIGLISREFPPFVGGGIGEYTRRLATALGERGHRVVVVTVSDDGAEHREEEGGVTIVRLPFIVGEDWSRPAPAVDSARMRAAFEDLYPIAGLSMILRERLPGLVEELGLEVLEFPDTGALGWFTLNARRTGRMETPPVVVCAHSPTWWVNLLNRDPGVDRATRALVSMEADCVRWADGLVCPSRALADWISSRHGVEGVEVVPLALGELEGEAPEAAPEGARRLLFAGRLEARKGVDLLLGAFGEAVSGGADLHLDLAGADTTDVRRRGSFGARLIERLVPAEARGRVSHHDRLEGPALRAMRARAVACVVPSPNDNYPYTCVEAMASGRPVLANRAGGMAEMIRDGVDGRLLEPTVASWAAALTWIAGADAGALRAMGVSARSRIRELCGNERIVERRVAHYERVVPGASSGRASGGRVVVVNPRGTGEAALESLSSAARQVGGFAIGWRESGGRVVASPSPSAAWLAIDDACDGAVCVLEEALERAIGSSPRTARMGEGVMICEDVPGLLLALLRAGVPGCVEPEAIVEGQACQGRGAGEREAEIDKALIAIEALRRFPRVAARARDRDAAPAAPVAPAEVELREIRSSRAYRLALLLRGAARRAGLR